MDSKGTEKHMDEDGRSHGKSKISGMSGIVIVVIIMGVLIGAYVSPYLDPILNPDRAAKLQNAQALTEQNKLLKQQVDCLMNGVQANHGKATIDECT